MMTQSRKLSLRGHLIYDGNLSIYLDLSTFAAHAWTLATMKSTQGNWQRTSRDNVSTVYIIKSQVAVCKRLRWLQVGRIWERYGATGVCVCVRIFGEIIEDFQATLRFPKPPSIVSFIQLLENIEAWYGTKNHARLANCACIDSY